MILIGRQLCALLGPSSPCSDWLLDASPGQWLDVASDVSMTQCISGKSLALTSHNYKAQVEIREWEWPGLWWLMTSENINIYKVKLNNWDVKMPNLPTILYSNRLLKIFFVKNIEMHNQLPVPPDSCSLPMMHLLSPLSLCHRLGCHVSSWCQLLPLALQSNVSPHYRTHTYLSYDKKK